MACGRPELHSSKAAARVEHFRLMPAYWCLPCCSACYMHAAPKVVFESRHAMGQGALYRGDVRLLQPANAA